MQYNSVFDTNLCYSYGFRSLLLHITIYFLFLTFIFYNMLYFYIQQKSMFILLSLCISKLNI